MNFKTIFLNNDTNYERNSKHKYTERNNPFLHMFHQSDYLPSYSMAIISFYSKTIKLWTKAFNWTAWGQFGTISPSSSWNFSSAL